MGGKHVWRLCHPGRSAKVGAPLAKGSLCLLIILVTYKRISWNIPQTHALQSLDFNYHYHYLNMGQELSLDTSNKHRTELPRIQCVSRERWEFAILSVGWTTSGELDNFWDLIAEDIKSWWWYRGQSSSRQKSLRPSHLKKNWKTQRREASEEY